MNTPRRIVLMVVSAAFALGVQMVSALLVSYATGWSFWRVFACLIWFTVGARKR